MTESVEQAAGVVPAGKKRRWLWVVGGIAAIISAYVAWNVFDSYVLLGESKITVSPETTYLTGPLNADGTVNYTQALIDRYSEGVTPDNNAVTLLAQAFGPDDFLPEEARPEILRQLGLTEEDLAGGKKFVRWRDYLKAAGLDRNDVDPDGELFTRLASGPWVEEDHPEMAAWLADNAEPLAIMRQAARRTHHYFPLVSPDDPPSLISLQLPGLILYRNAAWALSARATLHLAGGDIAEAQADADTIHRLAHAPHPYLIGHLVNIGMVKTATRAEQAIIMSGKLSPDAMRNMLAECKARPPLLDFADVLETELMLFLDYCTMLLYRSTDMSGLGLDTPIATPKDRSCVDWDSLLRQATAHYTRLIQAAKLPYPERCVQESQILEQMERDLTEGKTYLLIRAGFHVITQNKRAARKVYADVLARVLLSMLMPEFSRVHTRQEETQTRSDLMLLALAAKVYKADNGDWPAQLADLAPDYLDAIGRDRFTDEPLVYEPTDDGVRIYSLGPNMTDDGGLDIDEATDDDIADYPAGADDIAIELH